MAKMAQCNTCRKPLPKGAQFCGFCGTKVLDRCPKCGNVDLPGPNFCIKCGAALRPGETPASRSAAASDVDDALEAELKIYKATWEEGQQLITCRGCGAKNRVPASKLKLGATCGRCKQPLPAD